MARGTLRVYLGAAPGVGKTYDMLAEGRHRVRTGSDVVIGVVEDYGRRGTRRMAEGLERVPPRTVEHRGARFTELDVAAVLARRPEIALVDELAHTNVPGSPHTKRWQDVEELRDAGVDVLSTLNVQHLASLTEVVQQVTGVRPREIVPDDVVRGADQIELVDLSPEALRRRLAEGDVYPPDRVDRALSRYFTLGNLSALREITLLWAADRVEEAVLRYRREQHSDRTWPVRERVLVALSGGAEGETLVRRAERIASRTVGGELLAVHVASPDAAEDGHANAAERRLAAQRELVESMGGTWHTVWDDDPVRGVLRYAREANATQLVIGASRRGRISQLFSRRVGERLVEASGDDLDAYVVTHERAAHGRFLGRRAG